MSISASIGPSLAIIASLGGGVVFIRMLVRKWRLMKPGYEFRVGNMNSMSGRPITEFNYRIEFGQSFEDKGKGRTIWAGAHYFYKK